MGESCPKTLKLKEFQNSYPLRQLSKFESHFNKNNKFKQPWTTYNRLAAMTSSAHRLNHKHTFAVADLNLPFFLQTTLTVFYSFIVTYKTI